MIKSLNRLKVCMKKKNRKGIIKVYILIKTIKETR